MKKITLSQIKSVEEMRRLVSEEKLSLGLEEFVEFALKNLGSAEMAKVLLRAMPSRYEPEQQSGYAKSVAYDSQSGLIIFVLEKMQLLDVKNAKARYNGGKNFRLPDQSSLKRLGFVDGMYYGFPAKSSNGKFRLIADEGSIFHGHPINPAMSPERVGFLNMPRELYAEIMRSRFPKRFYEERLSGAGFA